MKLPGPLKHFILAFLIAVIVYAVFYTWIEHRRTRNGPWRVTFNSESGTPVVIINQPKLQIENVTISFSDEKASTNVTQTTIFDPPRPVPFDVPFGKCIFIDTTFQPGNVTFNLFGHEIQLLPRVLTIDFKEYPWKSGTNISLARRSSR